MGFANGWHGAYDNYLTVYLQWALNIGIGTTTRYKRIYTLNKHRNQN